MKSSKVLEMLKQNRIEELKAELQDEIFTESLKTNPTAKKRYAAMKRYLKTISESRPILTKPCPVGFEGETYNSFTNSYSLVLTTEGCGEIAMCDEPERYPDVVRLIPTTGEAGQIDFNKVLAEAKSKGYKYTKNAIHNNEYLMSYKGGYFRMALVDITYGVIAQDQPTDVYFNGKHRPLTIKNDLGIGIILPIRHEGDPNEEYVVVEAE
jgi:hypothetical protein